MRASRRRLLLLVGGSAAAGLFSLPTAASPRRRRLGVLLPSDLQWEGEVFREELQRLGYHEADVEILVRSAGGKLSALAQLAEDLVQEGVEVIVAANTPGARAAMAATRSIPIVVGVISSPELVDVRSISRPEGNITGVTNMAGEIVTKRLEVLKETLPAARRIACLVHPDEPIVKPQMEDLAPAAAALRVQLRYFAARNERDLRVVLDQAVQWRADALFRLAGQAATLDRLTTRLALEHRLPAMLLTRTEVEMGALLSYFADHAAIWRRVAQYADRLLKGAKVADMPFERPTKFELALNLRTARILGIRISPVVLLRADRIIE